MPNTSILLLMLRAFGREPLEMHHEKDPLPCTKTAEKSRATQSLKARTHGTQKPPRQIPNPKPQHRNPQTTNRNTLNPEPQNPKPQSLSAPTHETPNPNTYTQIGLKVGLVDITALTLVALNKNRRYFFGVSCRFRARASLPEPAVLREQLQEVGFVQGQA